MRKPSDLKIPFVWEDRCPVLLEKFCYVPSLYDHVRDDALLSWSNPAIFPLQQPVILEYCSGNGQWICEKAKKHPEFNWVALDLRFDRCRKTWLKLHRENLQNLVVLCGDARILTRYYLPKNSCTEIFMNFPDPWPKLRHAKHRLVQPPFIQEMQALLVSEGKATFVTDDPSYAMQMLEVLTGEKALSPVLPSPHYILDPKEYGSSFFFELWKRKGKNIYLLPFERRKV